MMKNVIKLATVAALSLTASAQAEGLYSNFAISFADFGDANLSIGTATSIVGYDAGAFQVQLESDHTSLDETTDSDFAGYGLRAVYGFNGGFEIDAMAHEVKGPNLASLRVAPRVAVTPSTDNLQIAEIGATYTHQPTGIYGRLSAFNASGGGLDDTGFGVTAGYKFFEGLDIQVGFFDIGDDQWASYNVTFDNEFVQQDFYVLAAQNDFTLLNWKLAGRLQNNLVIMAETGTSFFRDARQNTSYGLGLGYELNSGIGLYAKAMRYDLVNQADQDAIEVGVDYVFGKRGVARTGFYSNTYRRLLSDEGRLLLQYTP